MWNSLSDLKAALAGGCACWAGEASAIRSTGRSWLWNRRGTRLTCPGSCPTPSHGRHREALRRCPSAAVPTACRGARSAARSAAPSLAPSLARSAAPWWARSSARSSAPWWARSSALWSAPWWARSWLGGRLRGGLGRRLCGRLRGLLRRWLGGRLRGGSVSSSRIAAVGRSTQGVPSSAAFMYACHVRAGYCPAVEGLQVAVQRVVAVAAHVHHRRGQRRRVSDEPRRRHVRLLHPTSSVPLGGGGGAGLAARFASDGAVLRTAA
jgi:hypothetical protein